MILDPNLMALISTVVGGLLAITGGFLATSFSQRITEKAEKRKQTRERVEELYILSTQIKEWAKVQLLRACEVGEFTLQLKAPGWFFDAVKTEPDCPIEKMEMLVYLYLPSLIRPFETYHTRVLAIQHLETEMRNSVYSKHALEAHCNAALVRTTDIEERLAKDTNAVVEFIVQVLDNFEQSQQELRVALQQIAEKS
ncbi:hypothetical protein [Ktedonospora formicarum]|uniref:Uncharacterized protein n=1 Tax=Ktedonospora formicarum TaxID=2778364 RepID=A0A8J3MWQ2_9CHLR|nr:hypothetical protein [Ktedonospora formicarum]GHO49226.1 hypothetical protein KSX_73890 [Ktedonospora formicarum]